MHSAVQPISAECAVCVADKENACLHTRFPPRAPTKRASGHTRQAAHHTCTARLVMALMREDWTVLSWIRPAASVQQNWFVFHPPKLQHCGQRRFSVTCTVGRYWTGADCLLCWLCNQSWFVCTFFCTQLISPFLFCTLQHTSAEGLVPSDRVQHRWPILVCSC